MIEEETYKQDQITMSITYNSKFKELIMRIVAKDVSLPLKDFELNNIQVPDIILKELYKTNEIV